jgi:hypothetical protein
LALRDLRKQVKEKEGVQIPEGDPGEMMQGLLEAWRTGERTYRALRAYSHSTSVDILGIHLTTH